MTAAGCAPEGTSETSTEPAGTAVAEAGSSAAEEVQIVPGLTMKKLKNGYGRAAAAGDLASVHYTGWLYDANAPDGRGKKFDSSVDRGQPFQFPLGAGRVIRGWDEGVAGMLIGELRELRILPDLQVPGLADPVFTIDSRAEPFQALRDPVDVVLGHFGDLVVAEDSEFVQRFFDRGPDALDQAQVVAQAAGFRFV
jgi:hypothetical protein